MNRGLSGGPRASKGALGFAMSLALTLVSAGCEERTDSAKVVRPSEDATVVVQPQKPPPAITPDAGALPVPLVPPDADAGGRDAGTAAEPSPGEDVRGWLGLATVAPSAKSEEGWSPSHPTAEVVIPPDVFTARRGAWFVAVSPKGQTKITYTGQPPVPYGCDDNRAAFAAFDADGRFSEGAVWILPPEAASGATSVPVRPGKVMKGAGPSTRTWQVGPFELTAVRHAARRGVMTVRRGTEQVTSFPFEKVVMEGAEVGPIDLGDPDEIGVPFPRWAFRFGEDGPMVVVLAQRGYEGQTFSLLKVTAGGEVSLEEQAYLLYQCAF